MLRGTKIFAENPIKLISSSRILGDPFFFSFRRANFNPSCDYEASRVKPKRFRVPPPATDRGLLRVVLPSAWIEVALNVPNLRLFFLSIRLTMPWATLTKIGSLEPRRLNKTFRRTHFSWLGPPVLFPIIDAFYWQGLWYSYTMMYFSTIQISYVFFNRSIPTCCLVATACFGCRARFVSLFVYMSDST